MAGQCSREPVIMRGVGGVVDERWAWNAGRLGTWTRGMGKWRGGGEIVEIGKADGMASSIGSEDCPWWSSSSFWRLEGRSGSCVGGGKRILSSPAMIFSMSSSLLGPPVKIRAISRVRTTSAVQSLCFSPLSRCSSTSSDFSPF